MECTICGDDFHYPEYETDKSFGKLIGGTPGCTCDFCSEIIINGEPEELRRLLENRSRKAATATQSMSNREILREAHSLLADAIRTLESLDSSSASDRNIASLKNLKAAFREFEDSCCNGLVTPYSSR